MASGTRRQRQRQEELWYRGDLAEAPGHPFYRRLNELLDQAGFDEFCETGCQRFYHEKLGRPSLAPGIYFRVMLIGFFEGIESERGIAWRVADSLSGSVKFYSGFLCSSTSKARQSHAEGCSPDDFHHAFEVVD